MHPNPSFRETDENTALETAINRGFGILSINGQDGPLTAHVPFIVDAKTRVLRAHLVASNPIWRGLEGGSMRALVSVSGPDSYISPDWYDVEGQVPTWNYVAVNLRGVLSRMADDRLEEVLDDLSDHFEEMLLPKPIWKMDKLSEEQKLRMMRQIRPVQLEIDVVESTFKLGQNKPDTARLSAAEHVAAKGIGHEVVKLSNLMKRAKG